LIVLRNARNSKTLIRVRGFIYAPIQEAVFSGLAKEGPVAPEIIPSLPALEGTKLHLLVVRARMQALKSETR
jgi:hypothetical protein